MFFKPCLAKHFYECSTFDENQKGREKMWTQGLTVNDQSLLERL